MAKGKTYKELAIEFKNTKSERVYNQLYAKMRPGLRNYINNIVKDPHVADDIVSTTLTTVYLKIDQYDESYQITTWAYRIAYNECISWIRFRNRNISMNVFTDAGVEPPMADEMRPSEDDFLSGDAELWEAEHKLTEQVRVTQDAIKSLPPMYKTYMVERFLNHRSYNDILDIMKPRENDITLQTVKNRIFRGRKMIKKQLEQMRLFSEA